MVRLFKREGHRFVRKNIHEAWMIWTIRAWEGIRSFFHSLLVFLGFLFLVANTASSLIHMAMHYMTVSNKWERITTLKLETMTWQDMLALAAIPALLTSAWSMYSAYSRWHHWAHHGHKWDTDLSANGDSVHK